MKRAYIYSRVSTNRQVVQGVSLDAQEHTAEAFINYRLAPEGYVHAARIRDSAVSGRLPLCDRQGGGDLSRMLEKGDTVVIARLDRGFRSLKDALTTIDTWAARGITVHLLDLGLDTASPTGRLMLSVLGAVAEFEKTWRNERVAAARAELKRRGNYCDGQCWGFHVRGTRGNRHLEEDKLVRDLAKQMIHLYDVEKWTEFRIRRHMRKVSNAYYFSNGLVKAWMKREKALQEIERTGEGPLWIVKALRRRSHRPAVQPPASPESTASAAGTDALPPGASAHTAESEMNKSA